MNKLKVDDIVRLKPNIDYYNIYINEKEANYFKKNLNKKFKIIRCQEYFNTFKCFLNTYDVIPELSDQGGYWFLKENLIKVNNFKQKIKFVKELL